MTVGSSSYYIHLITREIGSLPMEGHTPKHLTSALQKSQDHQKQKSEKLSQPRGAKEVRMARYYVASSMGSWNIKRT
jgi:hypothetical protein